jgi:hypothetical protein
MAESAEFEFEILLRRALAPVEPPGDLSERLESTLANLTELAADELEAWELAAIKDPRNWPRAALRPAAAVLIGSGAAVGLVVLRTRRRRHRRRHQSHGALDLAERTLRDAAREAMRVFDDVKPR